jgi:prepilin-type N-terminal cleavage/methylation domain-containing protein
MHDDPLKSSSQGFSLAEVLLAIAISGVLLAAIISGFVNSSIRAEWSGYNLAAQNLAMQGVEQARAAKWDPNAYPPVDLLTNFSPTIAILDIPVSGTNIAYATNFFTINVISATPPVKSIQVDTVWQFRRYKGFSLFTNTLMTLRAPDQ